MEAPIATQLLRQLCEMTQLPFKESDLVSGVRFLLDGEHSVRIYWKEPNLMVSSEVVALGSLPELDAIRDEVLLELLHANLLFGNRPKTPYLTINEQAQTLELLDVLDRFDGTVQDLKQGVEALVQRKIRIKQAMEQQIAESAKPKQAQGSGGPAFGHLA